MGKGNFTVGGEYFAGLLIVGRQPRPTDSKLGKNLPATPQSVQTLQASNPRTRSHSKHTPGSVLRPGAISLCPTTARIG